jgi:tripartite-type tricarboxylate transporter receptor subunit TctC
LPDYKYESWFGLLAPAGTPPAILAQVSRDVGQVLKTPDMIEKLTTFGSIPAPNSPEQFDAMIKSDTERYGKVLRDAGVAVN